MDDETSYYQSLLALLSKRYRLRMRQIRNRRKMTHQIMIQKYMQYMQASQQLFQSYALKVLELFEPPAARRKREKIIDSWWTNQFPKLTDARFLKTFHVSRKFYEYLCDQLRTNLEPLPNKIGTTGTTVEKQVALGLYKLASGDSYKKTSRLIGVHQSTVHKLLIKFLKTVLYKFGDNLSSPTTDECKELARKTCEAFKITDIIGVALKKEFSAKCSPFAEEFYLLGFVDIDGKIRYVRTEGKGKEGKFYQDLKTVCCPPGIINSADDSPSYFVITDDDVPDYDCFVQKNEPNNPNSEEDLKDHVLKILYIKERAFRGLKARWASLRDELDYLPPMTTLVISSAVCLHNLCVEFGEPFFGCDD